MFVVYFLRKMELNLSIKLECEHISSKHNGIVEK